MTVVEANGQHPADLAEREPAPRGRARELAGDAAAACAQFARKAAAWRITPGLPGIGGIVFGSVAAGGIVGHFVAGIGPWVTLGVFAAFLLRIDSRIS